MRGRDQRWGRDQGGDVIREWSGGDLIGLVEDEGLDVAGAQVAAADHVEDAPRRARHNVLPVVELADVVTHALAADARVRLDLRPLCRSEHARIARH